MIPGLTMTVALLVLSGGASAPVRPGPCELPGLTSTWFQEVLDGWARVSERDLRLKPEGLPWIVLFDTTCTWHLAGTRALPEGARAVASTLRFQGRPVRMLAVATGAEVRLPDGQRIPPQPIASTGLYRSGRKAFFVLSLREVWRADPGQAGSPDLDRFLQGVIAHELAHTRHLGRLLGRVKLIARRHHLDNLRLNDDVVQTRFETRPGFRSAVEAERDLLFAAAIEPNSAVRAGLVTQALALARERRRTHFTGADSPYSELEDLFLSLEGVGQWAALALARDRAPTEKDATLIDFVRDNRRFWSQEVGFAQVLLLEKMAPGWQGRVLGPELASPRALLEEAVQVSVPQ